jgi:drug/metabolite transporter (DMT)-like permease
MKYMNQPLFKPYLAIVIGVIGVSFSAIFVRYSDAPSSVIAFYRMLFSSLILLPFFLKGSVKEIQGINKKDWILCVLAGGFLAFHFILWFESLQYTSVANSTVLVTLQPLFAFLGTYFLFKERVSIKGVLSIVVAITGSILISASDFAQNKVALFGDVLALIACALATAYFLIGQLVRKRIGLTAYTFIVYGISAFILLIYVFGSGHELVHYPKEEWYLFILLAIVPTILGHSLFNWAIEWVSTTKISMAILFEPVGAAILAYYLFNETVSATQLVGALFILIGLSLFILVNKRKDPIVDREVKY